MKKQFLLVGALAMTLALPLAACGGTPAATSDNGGTDAPAASEDGGFDAVEAYWGQWHGYVEITGETVYGTSGGVEPMLDVYLNEDGSCSVEPTEAHADLLTDEGTWEGTESEITLHLTDGDIVLAVDGKQASGTASDFGIADFDTILFDFYG